MSSGFKGSGGEWGLGEGYMISDKLIDQSGRQGLTEMKPASCVDRVPRWGTESSPVLDSWFAAKGHWEPRRRENRIQSQATQLDIFAVVVVSGGYF